MSRIHATAIIDAKACLACDVEIGPYCVIGPDVRMGERVRLLSHAIVEGHIGAFVPGFSREDMPGGQPWPLRSQRSTRCTQCPQN